MGISTSVPNFDKKKHWHGRLSTVKSQLIFSFPCFHLVSKKILTEVAQLLTYFFTTPYVQFWTLHRFFTPKVGTPNSSCDWLTERGTDSTMRNQGSLDLWMFFAAGPPANWRKATILPTSQEQRQYASQYTSEQIHVLSYLFLEQLYTPSRKQELKGSNHSRPRISKSTCKERIFWLQWDRTWKWCSLKV